MHSLISLCLLVFTTLLSPALSSPVRRWESLRDYNPAETSCLGDADVEHLVNGFALLVNSTYSPELAADIISPTFNDFSDSINFLTGQTPGLPTFSSKAQFDAGQGGQPPVPMEIISIDAVSCTSVAFRWIAMPGQYAVKGITIFYASQGAGSSNGWQIQTQFAEFNVAAWVNDLPPGNCTPPPPPPPAPAKE